MPILYKNTEGNVYNNTIGSVVYIKQINGQIQGEDFINLNGFIAYTQNFSKIGVTSSLIKPINFGLFNNIEMTTLEISY